MEEGVIIYVAHYTDYNLKPGVTPKLRRQAVTTKYCLIGAHPGYRVNSQKRQKKIASETYRTAKSGTT